MIRLQRQLGIERSAVKPAGGWVGEKISRFKLSERVTGDANLTRLLELETLSVGIAGKLALWQAIKASIGGDVEDFNFDD